jgi:hypothetical protein
VFIPLKEDFFLRKLKESIGIFKLIPFIFLTFQALASESMKDYARPFHAQEYKKQEIYTKVHIHAVGDGVDRSYVIYPEQTDVKALPLVIFMHGWLGTNPKNFGVIIDHLARRGGVVIYPVYQRNEKDAPQKIKAIAQNSIQAALTWINQNHPGMVRKDQALYYGFSIGATTAINLVAQVKENALPPAFALLLTSPGDAKHVHRGELSRSILEQGLNTLPVSIPIILMSGSEDIQIGVPTAYAYWNQMCDQKRLKNLILYPPGKSAHQDIRSGHGMPGAPDPRYDFPDIDAKFAPVVLEAQKKFPESASLNNLDYYGTWKVITSTFDSLKLNTPLPQWLFQSSEELKNLGHFESGELYPQAYLEESCPAKIPSRFK